MAISWQLGRCAAVRRHRTPRVAARSSSALPPNASVPHVPSSLPAACWARGRLIKREREKGERRETDRQTESRACGEIVRDRACDHASARAGAARGRGATCHHEVNISSCVCARSCSCMCFCVRVCVCVRSGLRRATSRRVASRRLAPRRVGSRRAASGRVGYHNESTTRRATSRGADIAGDIAGPEPTYLSENRGWVGLQSGHRVLEHKG